jgi:hypothetical protein
MMGIYMVKHLHGHANVNQAGWWASPTRPDFIIAQSFNHMPLAGTTW